MARLLQGFRTGTESQLFVHCATSVTYSAQLEAAVPGVSRYAERALLLAQQQDLVCVPDEVDADYLDYLASLGLGPDPANVIVLSRFGDAETEGPLWYRLLNSAEALRTTSELSRLQCSVHLHPFIATEGQFELARALGRRARLSMRVVGGDPAAVAYADCKHHIRAKALELDVPVAPGEVVDLGSGEGCSEGRCDSLLAAIERQIGRTGRVIVRGSGGAAGSATFIVGDSSQSHEALARALSRRTDNRIYLVESMVQPTVSPSIQIGIDAQRGSIECLGVTDQRLHGAVHAGNVYPSVARCAGQMVQWAR
ncbi:MAG TPA: hypothetical protein VFU40_04070, partial [Gemmatimonadales bacterium]|nr:hypothetical protein [Gemmatimonadales bacterium]